MTTEAQFVTARLAAWNEHQERLAGRLPSPEPERERIERVRFIRNNATFAAGDVAAFAESQARHLVEQGIALILGGVPDAGLIAEAAAELELRQQAVVAAKAERDRRREAELAASREAQDMERRAGIDAEGDEEIEQEVEALAKARARCAVLANRVTAAEAALRDAQTLEARQAEAVSRLQQEVVHLGERIQQHRATWQERRGALEVELVDAKRKAASLEERLRLHGETPSDAISGALKRLAELTGEGAEREDPDAQEDDDRRGEPGLLDEAADYLARALAEGPRPAADLIAGAPCSERTLYDAKKRAGVVSERSGSGWVWRRLRP